MKRSIRWTVTLLAAGLALGGCRADESQVDTAGIEPPTSWNSIPDGTPSGRLHGIDFEMKDARYYINDQPGRQWVTISLSASTAEEPCAAREPIKAPSVWIRLPGQAQQALAVRELTRAADADEGWSVHYQVPQDDAPWIGRGKGAALFAIRRFVPGFGIEGELAVCFADGMGSCVSGSFSARRCPNPVSPDVRQLDPAPPLPPRPKPVVSSSAQPAAAGAPSAARPEASTSPPP
jgi:hypothetical protein